MAATPADCSPAVKAPASAATRVGSEPNDRVPRGVAEDRAMTSQTGANTSVAPIAATSAPMAAPAARASSTEPVAPSAIAPGQAVAP